MESQSLYDLELSLFNGDAQLVGLDSNESSLPGLGLGQGLGDGKSDLGVLLGTPPDSPSSPGKIQNILILFCPVYACTIHCQFGWLSSDS